MRVYQNKREKTEREMAVTLNIPTALRQYAGGHSTLQLEAATVGELLRGMVAQYPDLGKHLYTDEGKLRSFVNIYVGDEDIRHLNGEATTLAGNDIVSIIPAIAGGRA
jgi:molybdopterin converting factor small subunit